MDCTNVDIYSIELLYKALNGRDEIKVKALLMLMLRNWLTEVSNFDPVSGHTMPTGIVDFMDVVAKSVQNESSEGEIKDRIYRIVSHTKDAVLAIMEYTRDKILREHAMLPIHAAREVDSNSVQWLSRQPGRTLREKLSGKPYMKAVRRRHSVDTAENRLLKAFLSRLEQILIERQNALSAATEETCEELFVLLQRWLRSEDASEIGAWENLPPNNTLLQDKRYRKIWDGWLWLQSIDEQITGDSKRVHQDILSVLYWNTLSLFNNSGRFRTVQQPVGLDYDNFSIVPELSICGYFFTLKGLDAKMQINMELLDDRFHVRVNEKEFVVGVYKGDLFLIHKHSKLSEKIHLNLKTPEELPNKLFFLVTNSPFEYSQPPNNQSAPIRMDSSVVDMCSIRPILANNIGFLAHLPFRLLQQTWKLKDESSHIVDGGTAKAILLRPDVETVSLRSLFLNKSKLSDAAKSSASMFFIKKLSDYITTDILTYLVPDWVDDFDLEKIRKSVNFYFEKSLPLPKSIAAIFAWQSSAGFESVVLNDKSEILVVDSFYGGFSVTPITVRFFNKLKDTLPQTKGITWERHPTLLIENNKILKEVVDKLHVAKCPFPEEAVQLFGLDGLFQEAGKLTLENESGPFHIPGNIKDVLRINQSLKLSSNSTELKKYLEKKSQKNTFVLPVSQNIMIDPLLENYKKLSVNGGILLTKGALFLEKWQKEVAEFDIALWRDHLPELSIRIVRDGHFENFYLVKDATVTPQRGRTVDIPVKESFTLTAGQTHYSFPLQQGVGNKELQFVAYLKSPAFPLKKATVCRLKMTYTYGADDPYELKFIPLNSEKAGFKSIRVEWRSASDGEAPNLENLPVPDFPARKSWSDFQKFPKEDGESFSDLLDWCISKLSGLDDLISFDYEQELQNILNRRKVGYLEWGTTDRTGKYYCRVNVEGESVFCHSSQFIEAVDENYLYEGCQVYLDIFTNEKGHSGSNISFSERLPTLLQEKAKDTINQKISKTIEFVEKGIFSLRFPALTIWNHGHSLSNPDVPDHFRNAIFEGTQKSLSVIESENMPETLKEELFFFLCCLHKDAPGIVSTKLLEAAQDGRLLKKNNKNIAFAIGDAELPWQQQLLRSAISPIDNEFLIRSITLEDLAIALWRSEALVFKLSETELKKLCNDLFRCIQFDMQLLTSEIPKHRIQFHLQKGFSESEAHKRERIYQTNTLCKHLELLLALLRSRSSEDEDIKTILAPNKDLTKKYVLLIDDISRIVMEKEINLKSRISLQIEKPEMFRNTPDLLYALRMYLTGDSGANSIIITGVTDEE